MLDFTTPETLVDETGDVTLTATARSAVSINDKHREIQRLGRTAKEIAAEIGEELIEVKQKLAHGAFGSWVEANCSFSNDMARLYVRVAVAKRERVHDFDKCKSIRDVLALGKPEKATTNVQDVPPPTKTRGTTADDLRKLASLRTLRDDPSATQGEKEAAQAKIDNIEGKINEFEADEDTDENWEFAKETVERMIKIIVVNDVSKNPDIAKAIRSALLFTYGDQPDFLMSLLKNVRTATR